MLGVAGGERDKAAAAEEEEGREIEAHTVRTYALSLALTLSLSLSLQHSCEGRETPRGQGFAESFALRKADG